MQTYFVWGIHPFVTDGYRHSNDHKWGKPEYHTRELTVTESLLLHQATRTINDCARKRPLAEGWSLGPARWEPRLKRHSIDFRNSIKSIIVHKLNHASARNMYQNINFMNNNWSVIHHNVYKLSTTFTYIQSKTCPLHFRMFTEYPQNFLKGAI